LIPWDVDVIGHVESLGQGDFSLILFYHVVVLKNIGIQNKQDRKFDCLPLPNLLFLEAEALDLVEVAWGLLGVDVLQCYACDVFVSRVGRSEESQTHFTRVHIHKLLRGAKVNEPPGFLVISIPERDVLAFVDVTWFIGEVIVNIRLFLGLTSADA